MVDGQAAESASVELTSILTRPGPTLLIVLFEVGINATNEIDEKRPGVFADGLSALTLERDPLVKVRLREFWRSGRLGVRRHARW